MTDWIANPTDMSGVPVEVLPHNFDSKKSGCTRCGGTLDVGWVCDRCGSDHFVAVKRMLAKKAEALAKG